MPQVAGEGSATLHLETVDSTMAEAWRRVADAGDALWIVADEQTAGRGRRGRAWVSRPGNLYATLLLRDPAPTARFGELCFVAGVALHEAVLAMFSPGEGVDPGAELRPTSSCGTDPRLTSPLPGEGLQTLTLKWPNDLLLEGAKLAGILIESESRGAAGIVAIGFGVNCAHHPDAPYPVTSLAARGLRVAPGALFERLATAMLHWLAVWNGGEGFSVIRAAWLARAKGLGQPIQVRLPHTTLEGVFHALDERGQLLLQTPAGLHPVAAGEIFLKEHT